MKTTRVSTYRFRSELKLLQHLNPLGSDKDLGLVLVPLPSALASLLVGKFVVLGDPVGVAGLGHLPEELPIREATLVHFVSGKVLAEFVVVLD